MFCSNEDEGCRISPSQYGEKEMTLGILPKSFPDIYRQIHQQLFTVSDNINLFN